MAQRLNAMPNKVQLFYTNGTETYCDARYGTAGVHQWHRDLLRCQIRYSWCTLMAQRLTAMPNKVQLLYTNGTETYCDAK